MVDEIIRTKEELEKLADLMAHEAEETKENVVLRYNQLAYNATTFIDGKKAKVVQFRAGINKEWMDTGIYTQTGIDALTLNNIQETGVARDLKPFRFQFASKGVELPTQEAVFDAPIPTNIGMYDEEFREFTRSHPNTRLERSLTVDQRIIVNSKGGKVIQTLPFLEISFAQGYAPIPTARNLSVVCTSDEDVKRMSTLVKFLADPTPDKRIKNAKSFGEAFDRLSRIAGLKYGTLQEAGIPLSELYDVVMLTGVPIHEIFGHHFEEPMRFLEFGESGTFKFGQSIKNKDIVLKDEPNQKINDFRVLGFTNFDAYGRKREPRIHIKDGQVVGFLGSEYADNTEKLKQYLNMEKSPFVGNASQDTNGTFPQPRMSCTVLDGPTIKPDLEGKILLVPHEGHTIPVDKTYMVKSFECYVIKNGEPRRVIPLQVTGGINQALASMELIDDTSYQTGMCGKPDPITLRQEARVPVSQLSKSQIWRGQQVYPLPISDAHLRILTRTE